MDNLVSVLNTQPSSIDNETSSKFVPLILRLGLDVAR
ncbi:MAG: hypothetical protein CM15mV125_240 [uncultured marine virus]|nr:MAG: hypothetical protein CM15mV125_240 [uncultured marine virus]